MREQKTYTLREYAEATGQSLVAVRQQAHRGTLPTQLVESPVGSYRVVSQAAVNEYLAAEQAAAMDEAARQQAEALEQWELEQARAAEQEGLWDLAHEQESQP